MGLFGKFKQSKIGNSDFERREFLSTNGRIADATVIDAETTDAGDEIVFYIYSVHGVDFESSELLTEAQKQNPLQYAPGAKVAVRFDPKNHKNSILI